MKTLRSGAALVAALSLFAACQAVAQVTEDGMGKMVHVELYACNFNEGMGRADLDRTVDMWNEWNDERDANDYAAWTLTPYYYGQEQDFDFIWMGAFSDGNSMGRGLDQWLAEGTEIAMEFDKVADCIGHVGLSSAMFKAPPESRTPQSAVITMMNCEMEEGTEYDDVIKAELAWAKVMTDAGSTAGTWHWFPTFGGGDQDFDYKVVSAHENFSEFGKDWEFYANGGGRDKSMSTFKDLDECDDARVYIAQSRRAAQVRRQLGRARALASFLR